MLKVIPSRGINRLSCACKCIECARITPHTGIRSISEKLQRTEPWESGQVPKKFWHQPQNQRKFLDHLAKQLQINSPEGWYQITARDIQEFGGRGLLNLYRKSVFRLITAVYSDVEWKAWKFHSVPKGYWRDISNMRKYIHEIAERLNIKQLQDWYRVGKDELRGASRLLKHGNLARILPRVYPGVEWHFQKFSDNRKRSSQWWLKYCLQKLFPQQEILEDYPHPLLRTKETELPHQLDVFIPQLSVAFEYQGKHHYQDVFFFGPQKQYQEKDNSKKALCKQHEITLIEVPYWWDRKLSSLASTVFKHRPDIISQPAHFNPIPDTPASARAANESKIRNMFVDLQEQSLDDIKFNPTGWWISELMPGTRCMWTGKYLYDRTGKRINAPSGFRSVIPKLTLDGILSIDSNNLEELQAAITTGDSLLWSKITFNIMDSPHPSKILEDRHATLGKLQLPSSVKWTPPKQCTGLEQLRHVSQTKRKDGKLILQKPASLYQSGNILQLE